MAEVMATELIKVVFAKLADKAIKEFVRSQGIRSELKNLEKTLTKIQKLLVDASGKENEDADIKDWLNRLQHLAYDIDDILDGLATDAMHRELNEDSGEKCISVRKFIPTCCTNFSLSNEFSHKLDSIAIKLGNLEKEKVALGLTMKDENPKSTRRIYETSMLEPYVVGREVEKEKLVKELLETKACNQNFSVVPIVGLGGVGKTTLARVLYNETQVKDNFELKAWVCVSDDFDVFKITKTIFEEVTKENKEFGNLNTLQTSLTEKLNQKRFLLVLDDVWSDSGDDWENLVRPFHSGAPGSKIIMTTRKEQLLKQLGFGHLDNLESLSPDDALSLFANHALGVPNFDQHPTFKPQGKDIVKKCGCLPLALKALGGLLRTKTDVEDWDEVLHSKIWGLENNKILPALLLSYHDLPASLKQLFAYCSLFPKDFMFDRDDLVRLWMAEGFLSQSTTNNSTKIAEKSLERLGHEYFEILLSRSFFQNASNDKSLYVMHDLMNDLALFVSGDYILRFDNQMEIQKKALVKYRHMSFTREEYVSYQRLEALKKEKSLRTLLAVSVGVIESWDYFYLSNKILVDLLPELPLLRVLSLSDFRISGLPEFIGSLKHLRYLNLSQTWIGELPENVCNLYNLQTLILFGCKKLSKLPTSFSKLTNLRHLDIRDTPCLQKMPLGIDELKNLQTLTKIIMGGYDRFAITEFKNLENLHGRMSIEGLDKVKDADSNLFLKSITELELKWSDLFDGSRNEASEKKVLSELKPHGGKLKKLSIMSYGGAEFPNWVGDPSFLQLVYVSIKKCRNCTSLPSLGQLPSLKELYISEMDEVKYVGSDFHGTTPEAFPSLEILQFKNMKGLEVWTTSSGVVFPRLQELCISGCPKLFKVTFESIPTNSGVVFPRLEELSISDCPDLVTVSFESTPLLRVLNISSCGYGVLRSLIHDSTITRLNISKIYGLTDVAWKGVMMNLRAVEELEFDDCNDIKYLCDLEAEASKVFINLKKLKVGRCSNLVSLGEKEEEVINYPHLTSLTLSSCESMKNLICGNNIESLSIRSRISMTYVICGKSIENLTIIGCRSLTTVSFPKAIGEEDMKKKKNIKSLRIYDCEKLSIKEVEGDQNIINNNTISSSMRRMSMLESVSISNWQNLKSINGLSYSIHLTGLHISDCKSLETLPDMKFVNLTSLKDMTITDCPNMDACFPRGNWPPNLSSLVIGGLKKPISEWGNQSFPTSLVSLSLYGIGGGDDENINEDLLPMSLTSLRIEDFEKLETVSKGLQHLTSLQHLQICKCPMIKDLPETLLPSLLSLEISRCPKLVERSKGTDSHYWPLISHIPRIEIFDY